jgi:hypothetical protein
VPTAAGCSINFFLHFFNAWLFTRSREGPYCERQGHVYSRHLSTHSCCRLSLCNRKGVPSLQQEDERGQGDTHPLYTPCHSRSFPKSITRPSIFFPCLSRACATFLQINHGAITSIMTQKPFGVLVQFILTDVDGIVGGDSCKSRSPLHGSTQCGKSRQFHNLSLIKPHLLLMHTVMTQ